MAPYSRSRHKVQYKGGRNTSSSVFAHLLVTSCTPHEPRSTGIIQSLDIHPVGPLLPPVLILWRSLLEGSSGDLKFYRLHTTIWLNKCPIITITIGAHPFKPPNLQAAAVEAWQGLRPSRLKSFPRSFSTAPQEMLTPTIPSILLCSSPRFAPAGAKPRSSPPRASGPASSFNSTVVHPRPHLCSCSW